MDAKNIDQAELPPPPVDDPFPSIQATLDAILADQRMEGWEIIALASDSVAVTNMASQYPRFRCRYIIFSADTATTMTLLIGSAQYPFEFAGIGPIAIPFPLVIERGTDVSFAVQGGADANFYLVGSPE